MNNMKIKSLGNLMSAFLLIAVIILAAGSVMTFRTVDGFKTTWEQFEKGPASKTAILMELRGAIGFGGMIHQFKNFALRQDRPRIVKIQEKIRESVVSIAAYRALGVNAKEAAALNDVQTVVANYAAAVGVAEQKASAGATPSEIDKSV